MTDIWHIYLQALVIILGMGIVTWIYSLYRKDVSMVDSLWSLMFLAAALYYAYAADVAGTGNILLLVLVTAWSLRLSFFLTLRNWDQPEDRRYQEIRRNNEPYFGFKSLYIIFGLQGLLAWIISAPLLLALTTNLEINTLVVIAGALWLSGFVIEVVADLQLYRFKSKPENDGKVLSSGLWHYSRHPNYFGEFLIWWSFYLFALAAGGWWSVFSPLLMTVLLLRVSGVALMEKDISDRRGDYREYIENTSAFVPWKPRNKSIQLERGHNV
jgi:steroid 5-alpha reductase family enzyme